MGFNAAFKGLRAVTNGGAILEVDCTWYVNVVNSEANQFSSESNSSRSLKLKIKCREGGGRKVEFIHVLALLKRPAAKFRQLPLPCLPV